MDPHGGDHEVKLLRQRDGLLGGADGRADVAEEADPFRMGFQKRAAASALEFFGEPTVVVVRVGVEEHGGAHHRTLSPRGVSGSRKTTRTCSSPDARIMPFDSMPQRTAGLRLATTMIFLPIRSSGS